MLCDVRQFLTSSSTQWTLAMTLKLQTNWVCRWASAWLEKPSLLLEKITQIFSPRHLFFLCPREFFSQLVFHVEMQRRCKVFLRFSSTAHFQDSWLLTTHWYNKEVVRKITFDEFSAQWFLYYLFRQFWHENSYFG